MTEPLRIAVAGGGLTGLAAAYRLSERLSILGRPFEIHLLEASERFGGSIASNRQSDFLLEAGADSFLAGKPRGLALCEELGLGRSILETKKANRRSFIAFKGRLVPVPAGFYLMAPAEILPLLFSSLLSLRGKLRLLKEPFIPLFPQEDETLGSFVRRRLGPEVLQRLAQPLVSGIYSADPETLSLRATFPQFLEMEKDGGVLRNIGQQQGAAEASGARYKLFVTLKNGMQSLVDQLAQRLITQKLRRNGAVQAIALRSTNPVLWNVILANGQTLTVDGLCLALPAPVLSQLFRPLDASLSGLLGSIPYADSITANFTFREKDIKHPMNGMGFVVPEIEKKTLTACTFVHRKFEHRAPAGYALLRAFTGGKTAAAWRDRQDSEIQGKLLSELKAYLGIAGSPMLSTLHRHRSSLPQYTLGHMDRLHQIAERVSHWPALSLGGNWGRGVGIPDCIDSGESAADNLVMRLCKI